jgi:hypothetical protein
MVVIPTVEWIQQDPTVDPSGFRDVKTTGFLKDLNTGAAGVLNFGTVDITSATQITDTVLAYARVSALNDASGVFNMRFFLTSVSDWNIGTYRFLERKEFHFQQGGISLTASDNDTPTSVPDAANLSGTITEPEFPLGKPWMSGVIDNDASQYAYLAVSVGTNVPIGIKGGAGAGSFRYRLLYDFS